MKCDVFIRKESYANAVLSGGTTMSPGDFWAHDEGTDGDVSSTVKVKAVAPMRYGLEDFSCLPSVFSAVFDLEGRGKDRIWPCVCEFIILAGHISVPQFFFGRLIQSPVFTCHRAALTCRHIQHHTRVKNTRQSLSLFPRKGDGQKGDCRQWTPKGSCSNGARCVCIQAR